MSDARGSQSSLHFYKVYHLDGAGRIKSSELMNAGTDSDALLLADELAGDHEVEVWDQTRFVGRIGIKVPPAFQTASLAAERLKKTV